MTSASQIKYEQLNIHRRIFYQLVKQYHQYRHYSDYDNLPVFKQFDKVWLAIIGLEDKIWNDTEGRR